MAVESESAAEEMMTQLLPRLTSDWEGTPFLFTYPRAFHTEIEQALLHGARIPQHWLQPVSLHRVPDDGPRILWRSGHPHVQNVSEAREPIVLPRGSAPVGHVNSTAAAAEAAAGDSGIACGSARAGLCGVRPATAAAFDAVRRVSRRGRLIASSAMQRGALAGELQRDRSVGRKARVFRVRTRRLNAQDVDTVAAKWLFASATAAQEVARLIATRHCIGVELEDVTSRLAMLRDSGAHGDGWFYWYEDRNNAGDDASDDGCAISHAPAIQSAEVKDTVSGEGSRKSPGLVSWAVEDEGGGVGLVYTVEGWRRNGLGRWSLAQLVDVMQADWQGQRRICAPFCVVADADYIGLRLVRSLGMKRGTLLYQLLAGGNEMMEPRFPENMACVQVAALATSPGGLVGCCSSGSGWVVLRYQTESH